MCLMILLAIGAAQAQTPKLKVYISSDMEGIGGRAARRVRCNAPL